MDRRVMGGLLLLLGVAVLTAATSAIAAPILRVRDPQAGERPQAPPPLLAPPGSAGYAPVRLDQAIGAPDGRPVAQLASVEDEFERVSVNFPPAVVTNQEGSVSFGILSSVRYERPLGGLLVTTARPSLAASSSPLNLGTGEITLANGATAWASANMPGEFPNRIVRVEGDLLITIASGLPLEALRTFAERVVVNPPSPSGPGGATGGGSGEVPEREGQLPGQYPDGVVKSEIFNP